MPCSCGKIPCSCGESCMCSCNVCGIVIPSTKTFCQERMTLEESKNVKLNKATLTKKSEKDETCDSQTIIENIKPDISTDFVQNTNNKDQAMESVSLTKKIDDSKESKLENQFLSQVEKNKTILGTQKPTGSADLVDTASKYDGKIKGKTKAKSQISPIILEIIGDLDTDLDIEELEAASRCGLTDGWSRVPNQAIFTDSKLCFSMHEINEEIKSVHKKVWHSVLKLKRIKNQLEEHNKDIEEFKEKQEIITKICFLSLSKHEETNYKEIFDKLKKYSSRIQSLQNNIYKFTNKTDILKSKVDLIINILSRLTSKMPKITAQFQRLSIDNQSVNTKSEIYSQFSEIEKRNMLRKMLKISEKMQKNLIYLKDFLIQSKRELAKCNQGLSKVKDSEKSQ